MLRCFASQLTGDAMKRRNGLRENFWKLVRPVRRKIVQLTRRPRVGRIDWGDLRTTVPISRDFGFDRGTPVDRYYIEAFLTVYSNDIRGNVIEIGSDNYTRRYGGERVERSDVIHHATGNPRATIVADLTKPRELPEIQVDCIICTQTMQFIYDARLAVASLYQLLKPGGVLLGTFSGISQISPQDMRSTGDYWRVTDASVKRLLGECFPVADSSVQTFGNVLSSIAFLHGVAAEELTDSELDFVDPNFPVIVAGRAVRPE